MSIKANEVCPCLIDNVPDQCRTRGMYVKVVEKHPQWMEKVTDTFKTKGTC